MLEVRPSSVAPDPAESRGAPPPPQDPSPLRGTLGSSLRSPLPQPAPSRARTLEAGKRWARLAQARAASRPGSESTLAPSGSHPGPWRPCPRGANGPTRPSPTPQPSPKARCAAACFPPRRRLSKAHRRRRADRRVSAVDAEPPVLLAPSFPSQSPHLPAHPPFRSSHRPRPLRPSPPLSLDCGHRD